MTATSLPGGGPGVFARDTLLVARFELAEALRSRLLVVMVLLFMGGGALGAWIYTALVSRVEQGASMFIGGKEGEKPGAALGRLRESRSYRELVRAIVHDDEKKADYFAALPPLVIFYGWAAFAFTPWLILFTSAETIASEVASRAIRFSLLRTRRLSYALGKGLGQLAIIVGVTAVSGLVFFGVAWLRLAGFEGSASALGMLSYWPRVLVYNLPVLAFALFASMATASANMARIVSLGGGVALAVLSGIAAMKVSLGGGAAVLWKGVGYLMPFGHTDGLFYPPGGELASDVIVCLALTVAYFGAGYAILRRRDV
jgi:ABC-type transport system involved in multi-copper enzyme maturation permease subunit